jgi:hypothetical protein
MYYLAKRVYEDGILSDEEISEFIPFIDKIVEKLKKSTKVVIMETPLILINGVVIQAMTSLLTKDDLDGIVEEIINIEYNNSFSYNNTVHLYCIDEDNINIDELPHYNNNATLYIYAFDVFEYLNEELKIIIRMGKQL